MDQKDASQNIVLLNKKEEKRIEDLFTQFSKAEPNKMHFYEFFMFCLDRSIISPRISFSMVYDLFNDCIDDGDYKGKERSLNKSQFNFILVQLARIMFPNEQGKSPVERMFNEVLLSEKTQANKEQIETTRVPQYDEPLKRIISEQAFQVLCQYEQELMAIFVAYISENYECEHVLLNWNEMGLEGKKMSSFAFIKFLYEANVIPNYMNIEHIEEIQHKIVPPIAKESEFYGKHRMVYIYEKQLDGRDPKYDNDPKIQFHEFQLLLGRIAFDERKGKEDKIEIDKVLQHFFQEILGIRTNENIETEQFPNVNKKLYKRLQQYYIDIQDEEQKEQDLQQESEGEEEDSQEQKDPQQLLAELQVKQIFEAEQIQFDLQDIYYILNKDLPQIPEEKQVQQENPPPYKTVKEKLPGKKKKQNVQIKVIIGDPIPPPPKDKENKNKPKPKAKKQLKKGEKPPRPIVFAGYPPTAPKLGYDHLEQINTDLIYGEKLLTNINRGTISNIEVIPVTIEEILYPPECPEQTRYLIESAINCYNQQNYIFALKHFEDARTVWHKLENPPFTDQIQLFFDYSKASIYSSAGRDDYALYFYMQCKTISDRLQYLNPDKSLAYSGLGSVLYNCEEWEMSLRSFLRCREIREKLYGYEHVDTACTYNNIGCCMYMLERNQEAIAYFKLSHIVFECEFGPYNNRTMTAAQNIKKAEKGYFKNIPEFKQLWETYETDPFKKKKKSKKKKKK